MGGERSAASVIGGVRRPESGVEVCNHQACMREREVERTGGFFAKNLWP